MPHYNGFGVSKGLLSPAALRAEGPRLTVEIGVPTTLATKLASSNQPLPQTITGLALIDTGASISCVDEQAVAIPLGLQTIQQMSLATPSQSTGVANVYLVRVSFPQVGLPAADELAVIGCTLTNQGIIALLGRDFLKDVLLVYNGTSGVWSLSF